MDLDLYESGTILERDHQRAVFAFSHPVLGESLCEIHRVLVNHAHHRGGPDAKMINLVISGGRPSMGAAASTRPTICGHALKLTRGAPAVGSARGASRSALLARSPTSNRRGTVAAGAASAELSSMYRHYGSEAETNLDTAIWRSACGTLGE